MAMDYEIYKFMGEIIKSCGGQMPARGKLGQKRKKLERYLLPARSHLEDCLFRDHPWVKGFEEFFGPRLPETEDWTDEVWHLQLGVVRSIVAGMPSKHKASYLRALAGIDKALKLLGAGLP